MRMTLYELTWASDGFGGAPRYFTFDRQSDAAVRLAERICELDRGAASGAWVILKRLPDTVYPQGMTLVAWTKTSDERPTHAGLETIPLAYFSAAPDAA
ncbi:MAG: hypothetical protein ACR652_00355 [Methylocystis sp.]|uniref:hypothetical protein n=1 Tax=Methylocystis sp. TaxID=1911079 RepID=UPI003DA2D69D